MNELLVDIFKYLYGQTWQIAIVFAVVLIISRMIKKRSSHARYLLWLVVLAKVFVPPVVSVPVAVLPHKSAEVVAKAPVNDILQNTAPARSAPAMELPVLDEAPPSTNLEPVATPLPIVEEPVKQPVLTLTQWLALAWLAGAGLFWLSTLCRAYIAQRYYNSVRQNADAALTEEVAALAGELGLNRAPAIWLIDGLAQPFVWGIVRGSIYLPADFTATHAIESRRGILLHELAHVARCDALINAFQTMAQGLFFFHPLVWAANIFIRSEREKCCDEIAVAHLGTSPKTYGTAIVEILVRQYNKSQPISSLAVAGPAKNIEDRIKTLMTPNQKFYTRPSRVAVVTVVLLAAIVVPTTLVLTTRAEKQGNAKRPTSNIERRTQEKAVRQSPEHAGKSIIPVTGRLVSEDNKPIVGALVRATIPSVHMGQMRRTMLPHLVETFSDQDGKFNLNIPVDNMTTAFSMDISAPGYKYSCGIFEKGRWSYKEPIGTWNIPDYTVSLPRALYIAGVVVAEKGNGLANVEIGAKMVRTGGSFHYVDNTVTDKNGRFEIFGYSLRPEKDLRPELVFSSPNFKEKIVTNIYELSKEELAHLNVVMNAPPKNISSQPAFQPTENILEIRKGTGDRLFTFPIKVPSGPEHRTGQTDGQTWDLSWESIKPDLENPAAFMIRDFEFSLKRQRPEKLNGKNVYDMINFRTTAPLTDQFITVGGSENESWQARIIDSNRKGNVEHRTSQVSSPEAVALLKKVRQRYLNLKSYSDSGETISINEAISPSGKVGKENSRFRGTFTMRMARPSYYLIEFQQKIHEYNTHHVKVWSEGKGDFLFSTGMDAPRKEKDMRWAISMASSGTADVPKDIPEMFFDMYGNLISRLTAGRLEKDDKFEGEDCYVLAARHTSQLMTLWISKKTFLVRKIKSVSDPNYRALSTSDMVRQNLGKQRQKFSSEDVEKLKSEIVAKIVKRLGQEPTTQAIEEMIKKNDERGKLLEEMLKNERFTHISIHRDIKVDFPVSGDQFHPAGSATQPARP